MEYYVVTKRCLVKLLLMLSERFRMPNSRVNKIIILKNCIGKNGLGMDSFDTLEIFTF